MSAVKNKLSVTVAMIVIYCANALAEVSIGDGYSRGGDGTASACMLLKKNAVIMRGGLQSITALLENPGDKKVIIEISLEEYCKNDRSLNSRFKWIGYELHATDVVVYGVDGVEHNRLHEFTIKNSASTLCHWREKINKSLGSERVLVMEVDKEKGRLYSPVAPYYFVGLNARAIPAGFELEAPFIQPLHMLDELITCYK